MDDCITVDKKLYNCTLPSCGICGCKRYISILARTRGIPLILYKRWLTCETDKPLFTYIGLNSNIEISLCIDCALATGLPILRWRGPGKKCGRPVREKEMLKLLRERLNL